MAGIGPLDKTGPSTRFYAYADVIQQSGNSSLIRLTVQCYNGPVSSTGSYFGGSGGQSSSMDGFGISVVHSAGSNFLPSGYQQNQLRWSDSQDFWLGHDGDGYLAGSTSHGFRMGIAYDVYNENYYGTLGVPRIARVPYAPTSLGIDQVGADSFRYRFSGNDDGGSGIQEWQIQLATNSGFTTGVQTISSNGTSTISGLANHTQYWVRSRGRNGVGWGTYSTSDTTTTTGHPTVPTSVSTTPSTSVTGRIQVNWSAPATTGAGGIVGYNIFRDGVQIATTTGTTTGYTDNGRTPYTTYAYRIAARNAYSTGVSGMGPQSTAVNGVAPGPPTAPINLTAVADGAVPGKVDLSWTAPTSTGTGGITGYKVYFAGGSLIVNQNGTGTTYSVTGLNPGTTYSFQVFARNALSDTEGTMSAGSNTPVVTPIGEPNAPTGLTVTQSATTSNRLVLSWTAPAGTLTGFNVFNRVGGVDTLIGTVNNTHTTFTVDGLTAGSNYTYVVRARTAYTDTLATGYPGNWGGPASTAVTAAPSVNNTQTVPTVASVVSGTNAIFAGTYTINAVTATTVGYAKTAANQASSASGGNIANNTNAIYNGNFTITSTPSPTSFTYAKTNANIALLATTGGLVTDTTNQLFNGTFTVSAVNSGANTISYANPGSDLGATAVPVNALPGASSFVTNLSNSIFNSASKTITAATEYTLSYAQTNANVTESGAAGVVTNNTNKNTFNGTYTVASIPAYNVVRYARTASNIALRSWIGGNAYIARLVSPSTLDVRFRSGWSG